ncbi:endo-1,4-beta-xylanase [Streptomyces sp. RTd22]|uniref:endo-1,4-beta-xylanase n=1 Tax=Streptomyces sp. RTd22 TaxID=1841249 RepID=UPI0007C500BC|nr:endo-1,4-beta-xylanase [Streptomyces sp. RTd22]
MKLQLLSLRRAHAAALVASAAALAVTLAAPTQAAGAANPTLREVADRTGRFVGTAVNDGRLGDGTYANIAKSEFSSVTAENAMKWGSVEPNRGQFNWAAADRLVSFAQANRQKVYGHTLVWHSQMPNWLANGSFSNAELRTIMTGHVTTQVARYKGKVQRWDVVNEAFNENGTLRASKFYNQLGQSYIADAFRAARAADPSAKLFINDYNTEGTNAKSDGLYNLVKSLKSQGVPIDGVGFQSHLIVGQVPSTMKANLQRFADLGVEVVISELDIRMATPADATKLQQQANDYKAVARNCLAIARCTGITVWGFGDRDSWVPDTFPGQGAANLYDTNYQPKPAYNAFRDGLAGS